MQEKTARIWGTVSPERYDKLRAWADELGLQFSQYVGLCTWLGAKQLQRSISPEEVITPDMWAQIIASYATQQGIDIEPDMVRRLVGEVGSVSLQQSGVLEVHDDD